MFKHILIATDGSDLAQVAVQTGLELAKALGAKVTAVTVTQPWAELMPGEAAITPPVEEYVGALQAEADTILSSVAEQAKTASNRMHVSPRGRAASGRRHSFGRKGNGVRPHRHVDARPQRSATPFFR